MPDNWLVDGNIDVDVEKLQDFAMHIRDELDKNFRPSFEHGIRPMLTVQAPFGGGGLEEGKFFRARHDEARSAAAQLLGEAAQGLMLLSTAAMSIAGEYLMGDAMAQATNQDVLDAFQGVDGQKTLNDFAKNQPADAATDPAMPEQAKDPGTFFNDSSDGSTPEMYRERTIGEGGPGEYKIEGDNEDMHNEALKIRQYEH